MCQVSVHHSGVGKVYSPAEYESFQKRLLLDYTEDGGSKFLRNVLNVYKFTLRHDPKRFNLCRKMIRKRYQSRL